MASTKELSEDSSQPLNYYAAFAKVGIWYLVTWYLYAAFSKVVLETRLYTSHCRYGRLYQSKSLVSLTTMLLLQWRSIATPYGRSLS